MKQYIILFLAVLTLSAACKKNHGQNPGPDFHPDYFIFGKDQSMCEMCNIVGISYYMVNDHKLYSEYIPGQLFSTANEMADSNYLKVQPLIDQFPAYFLSHTNSFLGSDTTGGVGGTMNIIAVTGTDTLRWQVSANEGTLPTEIQPYMNQLLKTWQGLRI